MTDIATNIDKKKSLWLRIHSKFFFEGENIQEIILPFAACSHPCTEIFDIYWLVLKPEKWHKICTMSLLKRGVSAVSWILVFGLCKEFGQCLPAWVANIIAGKVLISTLYQVRSNGVYDL